MQISNVKRLPYAHASADRWKVPLCCPSRCTAVRALVGVSEWATWMMRTNGTCAGSGARPWSRNRFALRHDPGLCIPSARAASMRHEVEKNLEGDGLQRAPNFSVQCLRLLFFFFTPAKKKVPYQNKKEKGEMRCGKLSLCTEVFPSHASVLSRALLLCLEFLT